MFLSVNIFEIHIASFSLAIHMYCALYSYHLLKIHAAIQCRMRHRMPLKIAHWSYISFTLLSVVALPINDGLQLPWQGLHEVHQVLQHLGLGDI
jgi:hypothetical protein